MLDNLKFQKITKKPDLREWQTFGMITCGFRDAGVESAREEKDFPMISVLVSCEHATCAVPEAQRALFAGHEDELQSDAGWEPGALNLAQGFAMAFRTPLVYGEFTRLLVDLEADESARWSRYAKGLSEQARERFTERVWGGYRATLRQRITEDLRRHDAVVHVLAHTGGVSDGTVNLRVPHDGGLAARIAAAWAKSARAQALDARHLTGDIPGSLIRELAADFPPDRYAPVRLEVASGYFLEGSPMRWESCKKSIVAALREALQACAPTPDPP